MGTSSSKQLGAKSTADDVVVYFNGDEDLAKLTDLSGQTVVITGANIGLGKESARVLFNCGATVVMACRNVEKAQAARDDILKSATDASDESHETRLRILKLDLSSLQSVRDFVAELLACDLPPLRILLCNAGIMALKKFELSADGYEMQFAVNYLSHVYLCQLLLPTLAEAAPSKVETETTTVKTVIGSAVDSDGAKSKDESADASDDEKKSAEADALSAVAEHKTEEEKDSSTTIAKVSGSRIIMLGSAAHKYAPKHYRRWIVAMASDCVGPRKEEYGANHNYGFSKACDIMFARELQRVCAKGKAEGGYNGAVACASLHPGIIYTQLWDNLPGIAKTYGKAVGKTVPQGAATQVYVSLLPHSQLEGGYFDNCKRADASLWRGIGQLDTEVCEAMGQTYDELLYQSSLKLIEAKGFSLTIAADGSDEVVVADDSDASDQIKSAATEQLPSGDAVLSDETETADVRVEEVSSVET